MTKLKTINIKGKEYVMVKDRIVAFNEAYTNGMINTEIVKNDDKSVVFKAIVYPDVSNMNRSFTGFSEAYRAGQMGDVPIEVAETSAVGRALAMMGIGVVDSVASADEIKKSFNRQELDKEFPNRFAQHTHTMLGLPVTPAQRNALKKIGFADEQIDTMDRLQASNKIGEAKKSGLVESNSQEKAREEVEHDINYDEETIL